MSNCPECTRPGRQVETWVSTVFVTVDTTARVAKARFRCMNPSCRMPRNRASIARLWPMGRREWVEEVGCA